MKIPEFELVELFGQPNIDDAGFWGEGGGEGRIMLHPEINGAEPVGYYWWVLDGASGEAIAEGRFGQLVIQKFKTWVNNVEIWLESHWEIWQEDGEENIKFGFRIRDLDKEIHLVFRVRADFNDGYYGIWQKEFRGKVEIDDLHDRGYVSETDTILTNSNFDDDDDEESDNCDRYIARIRELEAANNIQKMTIEGLRAQLANKDWRTAWKWYGGYVDVWKKVISDYKNKELHWFDRYVANSAEAVVLGLPALLLITGVFL